MITEPPRRSAPPRVVRLVTVALVAVAAGASGSGPFPHRVTEGLADLRTPELTAASAAKRETAGRAALESLAARHGIEAWRQHQTLEVVGTDRWSDQGPWWPQRDQHLRLQQWLGTFTSRAILLDGPEAGSVRGIQSWIPYRRDTPFGKIQRMGNVRAAPPSTESFYLPSLHYFNELPFRLLSATMVLHADAARLGEREYDRIFVTWESASPRPEVDQYVLWIDQETGLLAKAHYTVREAEAMVPTEQRETVRAGAAGTLHLEDYRPLGGVLFPFVHTVTLFGPNEAPASLESGFVHRFEIERASYDLFPTSDLLITLEGEPPGDRKP